MPGIGGIELFRHRIGLGLIFGLALKGRGMRHEPQQVPQFESTFGKLAGEPLQQAGMGRRVGFSQVVGWLDETAAEHGFPEAIDLGPSEQPRFLVDQPLGQFAPVIGGHFKYFARQLDRELELCLADLRAMRAAKGCVLEILGIPAWALGAGTGGKMRHIGPQGGLR